MMRLKKKEDKLTKYAEMSSEELASLDILEVQKECKKGVIKIITYSLICIAIIVLAVILF